jgi:DNA topoisomerase-2
MTTITDLKSYSDIQHVLLRSDMYVGSIKTCKETRWIIQNKEESNQAEQEAVQLELEFNPALEQCILELLVNAADHVQRCKTLIDEEIEVEPVTKIKVDLKIDHITVYNNGQGIPLELHPETKLYGPEMVFGNMRSGSNYDDTKKRIVGGRNGIGAKAANIFSIRFIVEIQTKGKKYYQEFSNNMKTKTKPVITTAT